jgi:hypothetical protein
VQNFLISLQDFMVSSGDVPYTKYLLMASGIIKGANPFPKIGSSMNKPFFLIKLESCDSLHPSLTPT